MLNLLKKAAVSVNLHIQFAHNVKQKVESKAVSSSHCTLDINDDGVTDQLSIFLTVLILHC